MLVTICRRMSGGVPGFDAFVGAALHSYIQQWMRPTGQRLYRIFSVGREVFTPRYQTTRHGLRFVARPVRRVDATQVTREVTVALTLKAHCRARQIAR